MPRKKKEEIVPEITEIPVVPVKKARKPRKPKEVAHPVVEAVIEAEKLPAVVEAKTVTVKKTRKANPWILHSKKVQADNPNISYREVLKLAKLSYRKPTKE